MEDQATNVGVCTPRYIPNKHVWEMARRAALINPINGASFDAVVGNDPAGVHPQRIAALTSKLWDPTPRVMTISFVDGTPRRDFRERVVGHANMWQCGKTFAYTEGVGDVRISRGRGGYYSYVGTDNASINPNRHTMNLEGFTMNTPATEWLRVVCHEIGHFLGFDHEHLRREIVELIDKTAAYAYYRRYSGWGRSTVDRQVLTPSPDEELTSTEIDPTSIMAYHLPASIMKNREAVPGGNRINARDLEFAKTMYPPQQVPDQPVTPDPDPLDPLPDGPEWEGPEWDDGPEWDEVWGEDLDVQNWKTPEWKVR